MALRCLIVDDNAHVLAAVRSLLAREGMVVGVAASGAEALARAEEFHPDVVLVDIELGQECGLDLPRQHPVAPDPQHCSVIFCSAHSAQDLAELIAELDADARRREANAGRREAHLAAELASLLLRTQDLRSALPAAAQCLAQTLELPCAVIELDTVADDEHHTPLPLRDGTTRLGTLLVSADLAEPTQRRLRERVVPSLEALLRAALERQAIGRALETSRDELRLLAEQQAALRRVATLVARGVSPPQLFAAVAEEMGQILGADFIEILRYGTDGVFTVVGTWTRGELSLCRPLGSRWPIKPGIIVEVLLGTGRPARIDLDGYGYGDGVIYRWVREQGITSGVGCPIVVEGRHWGAMIAFSTGTEPQPTDTEERMLEFTELVATAIANTESRAELRGLAEQQAALRRVATLVARGVSHTEIFAAVAEQMGTILHTESTEIIRYGADCMCTVVGSWTRRKPSISRPVSCCSVEPGTVVELVLRTGRPARISFYCDGYGDGVISRWVRAQGITSAAGCPIVVEGRQWGAMLAFTTGAEPQPADTEERMQEFTELVATAIANTESRTELIASRSRVVTAADQTRRRIERDLHDGTQQRLVSLALELRAAQAATPPGLDQLGARLSHTAQGLAEAVTELREISRGIHPAILSSGGIGPALKTLARRSAVPVELAVSVNQRLSEPVEVAAYYIVSEALTNVTKYAHASVVHVNLDVQDGIVRLSVRDDGDGGANPGQGSGLTGLRDRVETLSGTIEISSPRGGGTSLTVTIPIHNDLLAAHPPAGSRHRWASRTGACALAPSPPLPSSTSPSLMPTTRTRSRASSRWSDDVGPARGDCCRTRAGDTSGLATSCLANFIRAAVPGREQGL